MKDEVEAMKDSVKKIGKELGVEIKFDAAKSLLNYKRGRPLLVREVKKLAGTKTPVWVYCKANDEEGARTDNAMWVERYLPESNSIGLGDGSSFAHDMEFNAIRDDDEADDRKGGWGVIRVYEAVPITAQERKDFEKAKRKILAEIKAFERKHRR